MRKREEPQTSLTRALALAQAAYYIVTGVWPLVSMGTFEKVTGPKTDRWLVKTAGVLITAIGAALAVAARRQRMGAETPVLGVGSALGLTGIDVIYVARGRISRVYLLDALAEIILIGGWGLAWLSARSSTPASGEDEAL